MRFERPLSALQVDPGTMVRFVARHLQTAARSRIAATNTSEMIDRHSPNREGRPTMMGSLLLQLMSISADLTPSGGLPSRVGRCFVPCRYR